MADIADQLKDALRDRYVIERELGRGGMATVYLAHDLRHDRPVALKVLHPDLAHALGPERFQREIRLAARLQHPHILTVLDSGEAAGHLWFTMPFVEGESLRDRLRREKQLPVDESLRIAREAGDALDYAHRHGVIHRDIKPENILLTEGHALVADFGIGKALGGASEAQLTETGLTVGTPAYMSPEQAAGDKDLTARSDVYSLGIVLYEMLAGETPFAAPTAQAMIARRFMEVPKPVRELRDSVPEAAAQAVHRALARTAADRYATAAEFAQALHPGVSTPVATPAAAPARGLAAGLEAPTVAVEPPRYPKSARRRVPVAAFSLGLGILIGLGVLFAWRRSHLEGDSSSGGLKRLAVLPFENLGDSASEYFADGVTDAIRGKLTALPGLQVTARSSSAQYKKSPKPPQQVGQELGVQYLLTGTVRWEKGQGGQSQVQVSPELIEVSSAAAKWQQPFEAPLTDVFRVQAEVAGRVAEALDVALGTGQRAHLAERPTANLAAYDAFLRGDAATRGLSTVAFAALLRGLPYYQQAVALDSTFALAWSRLARLHAVLYNPGNRLPADSAAAEQAARRALALAPDHAETRLALGDYYRALGDNARALEQYQLGHRLAPGEGSLLSAMAIAEQSLGRWEDAVAHARDGFRLDPRSSRLAARLARTLVFVRRYDEALAAADQAVRLDPSSPDAVWIKAVVHVARGDLEGAQAVYRSASPELDRTTLVVYVAAHWELAWTLDREDLDLLVQLSPEPFGGDRAAWGLALAQAWALKGDTGRARAYADSGRMAYERVVATSPQNDEGFGLLALCLAYLGRYDEAGAAAKHSLALLGLGVDKYGGAYNQLQLVRVYVMAGQWDHALDELEVLLRIPLFITPGWLKIDPTFAPLRANPRFERLVNGR